MASQGSWPVAILGSGNIGTDLMIKILRSGGPLTAAAMVASTPASDGLARAKRMGVATTADGIDGLNVRADTTVVEADVGYPTDSGLLAQAVGSIARTVARIKDAGGATRTRIRDRRRSAGRGARSARMRWTRPAGCRSVDL